MGEEQLEVLLSRLDRLESKIDDIVRQRAVREWYSTEEAAAILGKAEFTVREWCRNGRVHAEKKASGRGKYKAWVIAAAELERIQREGLLPQRR